MTPDLDNFQTLFVTDTPLLDVRSPIEFAKGSLPTAINAPLMEDSEREAVGICYQQSGQAAAVQLGHELVTGALKEARVARWKQFAEANPHGALFCFRGGLRSEITQQWLAEAGINYPRIKGGYKSLRQWLSQKTETIIASTSLLLVGGQTGVAKTRLLNEGNAGRPIPGSIDLEGLANHRGSAFGRRITAQPTQIAFELAVGVALVQYQTGNHRFLILEDEGRLIGRVCVPDVLQAKMAHAPMVLLEQSIDERIDVVIEDYIVDLGERYQQLHGEQGAQLHADKLQADLLKIRKRLGGERHQQMSEVMARAFDQQHATGDLEGHRQWIGFLLEKYYDPMYEYQLEQRVGEVLYRGNRQSVLDWVGSR